MLAPVLENVAEEVTEVKFIKFSVETHKELATSLGIKSIPTLILYNDGVELDRVSGYMPKKQITEWINTNVSKRGQ